MCSSPTGDMEPPARRSRETLVELASEVSEDLTVLSRSSPVSVAAAAGSPGSSERGATSVVKDCSDKTGPAAAGQTEAVPLERAAETEPQGEHSLPMVPVQPRLTDGRSSADKGGSLIDAMLQGDNLHELGQPPVAHRLSPDAASWPRTEILESSFKHRWHQSLLSLN